MRSIIKNHKAENAPIGDLVTHRVLPTKSIDYLDPFLFLNHHGPQSYPPGNNGLPFGPHPHRGMETVTFILDGDIMHKDSSGSESVMTAGGVQWMTAGKGLIHAEVSSDAFKKNGGKLEILQLWINLPAKSKMMQPAYRGLQKDAISVLMTDDDKVSIQVISGDWESTKAPFKSGIGVRLSLISFKPGGKLNMKIPSAHNIFFYVIRGTLQANGTEVPSYHLAEFNHDGDELSITSAGESLLLFGHANPLQEPMVAQGPFVMNSIEEIEEAYHDYHHGKFGTWPE